MLRLFPRYDRDDIVMKLFYKAVSHQWSAEALDWDAPTGLTPRQALALTNVITPVYLGEQAAMNGAALVLPQIISHGETTAQLYLATFLLDEARHFDVLTRLYTHFGNRPVALRRIPEMLRYHQRLSRGDRVDWLWGILISDIFAREFYLTFAKVQPRALFGQMSAHILRDESRHQAFAHAYLKNAVPQLTAARRLALVDMKNELLETMRGMHRRLEEDAEVLGIDGAAFFQDLSRHIEAHAVAIGLDGPRDRPGPNGGSGAEPNWMHRLADLRRRALTESDGLRWPILQGRGRPSVPPGSRLVAENTPELTAADLRLLVGPRPARRIFPVAPSLPEVATCAVCALVRLCKKAMLRGAPAARA